ncbi:hypothetical protein [Microbacterium sp.]|uniref:hypothetical protein n=1 Tax=Microbacterium sp. TaxID=51671 RepID=UPI003A8B5339
MGVNIALSVIEGTTLAEVGVEDSTPMPFDEAEHSMDVMGTQVGDRVVLIDSIGGQASKELAEALGRQVYTVVVSSVSDTYVWEARGGEERLRVLMDGEIAEDQGEPLDVEEVFDEVDGSDDGFVDHERQHLELFNRVAGVSLSDLWDVEFVTVRSDPTV